MRVVFILSMIGIQLDANEVPQDQEEIEYLKQLVKRLTLGQNTILKGLIQSVEKQSSKFKNLEEDIIDRIKYEVLQESIKEEESLRELGLEDLDMEGIEWVTTKLSGAATEEDSIAKVLKGMSNQDLKALKNNIGEKLLHQDQEKVREALEEMTDGELEILMENVNEDHLADGTSSRHLMDEEKVLDAVKDMDDEELEVFIENVKAFIDNEVEDQEFNEAMSSLKADTEFFRMAGDAVKKMNDLTHQKLVDEENFKELGGMIHKVQDDVEDIEHVMDKMSDDEIKVALKNVEDQELGEMITAMDDQDFNEVMSGLKADTEEISMARNIVKMIESEELDEATHQKLEQHGKLLSKRRRRRDLSDLEKNTQSRQSEDSQNFSPPNLLSTIADHQKLMANIVEKEKESRERKRRGADILEKQKQRRRREEGKEIYKEPTYLAPGFESGEDNEERKKSAGILDLLNLYENSRKKRQASTKDESSNENSDRIESFNKGDRKKRHLPGLDWLFSPQTTINSLIGHQDQPDNQESDYKAKSFDIRKHFDHDLFSNLDQDFLNPFSLLRKKSEEESESEYYYREPHTTYHEPQPEPTYHEPQPEPTYHEPLAEPESQPNPTCDDSDPSCQQPQPSNCDGSDPACLKPQPPVVKPLQPIVKPQPPVVKPQSPVVKPQPPVVNPQPPTVKPQPPVVKPQPPVVKPQPPVVKPQPPVVKPQPPTVKPQPPVVNPQPPVVKPQPPVVEPQPDPPTDHDHDHHHTTISLGSDVYELVSSDSTPDTPDKPSSTLDNTPQPNTPSEDTDEEAETHDHHHHTTISLGSNIYELSSSDTPPDTPHKPTHENEAPRHRTIRLGQRSKPINTHMKTLQSVKFPHQSKDSQEDAAPTDSSFQWSTFRERREAARPEVSRRMKSAQLERTLSNVPESGKSSANQETQRRFSPKSSTTRDNE